MPLKDEKHTLFLLENDADRRAYIRQCLSSVVSVKRVIPYHSVDRAIEALQACQPKIIVVSSDMFDRMEPGKLDALKLPPQGSPVSIVVTLTCDQRFGEDLARRLVKGADAFFVEPYISDELGQVISLIVTNEMAEPAKRVRAALSNMVGRLRTVVDTVAFELKAHDRAGRVRSEMKKLASAIRTIPEEYGEEFYSLMLREFSDAPIKNNYQALLTQLDRDAKIAEALEKKDAEAAAKAKSRNEQARRVIRK